MDEMNEAPQITRDMVKVCVLARLQAEGRTLESLSDEEMNAVIFDAILDLTLAADIIAMGRQN
jgi:hypothetical protein